MKKKTDELNADYADYKNKFVKICGNLRFKFLFLVFWLLFPAAFAVGADGYQLETVQKGAWLISEADSNDTALDVNTASWSVCQDWRPDIPAWANGLKVMFYAQYVVVDEVNDLNEPNDSTFSYQFYVADYGGNAQIVASGDATVGAMQLSHDPVTLTELNDGDAAFRYCWVDTLGAITTDWKGGVTAQNDALTNDCAAFIFDRQSAKKAWCRIYSRSNANLKIYCIAHGY